MMIQLEFHNYQSHCNTFLAFLSATAATDFFAGDADFGVVAVGHSLVSMSLSKSNFFLPDFCQVVVVEDSMIILEAPRPFLGNIHWYQVQVCQLFS